MERRSDAPSPPSEELIRRASRVQQKVSQRDPHREGLLLSAIGTKNYFGPWEELLKERAIFWNHDESAPKKVVLHHKLEQGFPPEFYENPTRWIEEQENIAREEIAHKGEEIADLRKRSYDISRVKEFSVTSSEGKNVTIVCKRNNRCGREEAERSIQAYKAGIPTPRLIGLVEHWGNTYLMFEKVEGRSLLQLRFLERSFLNDLKENIFLSTKEEVQTVAAIYRLQIIPTLERWGLASSQKWLLEQLLAIRPLSLEYRIFNDLRISLMQTELYDKRPSHLSKDDDNVWKYWDALAKQRLEPAFPGLIGEWSLSADDIDFIVRVWSKKGRVTESEKIKVRHICATINRYCEAIYEQRRARVDHIFEVLLERRFSLGSIRHRLDSLKHQIQEAGLEHKDFDDRNVMVAWDSLKNKPKLDRKRSPQLFVIDWETPEKERG